MQMTDAGFSSICKETERYEFICAILVIVYRGEMLMNYVVVDFEWNQSMGGRDAMRKRVPFEIIEIGAVLLDEDLNEIDRFSQTVRPKIYRKLHRITKELTGITQEELDASDPFSYVLVDFMLWCGNDFTFCTWGNTDLIELQRNMKYYHLDDLLPGPIKYYTVQKLFAELVMPQQRSAALETAIEYLGIPENENFHRAVNDAAYTAAVMRHLDMEAASRLFSVDYYQNPKSRAQEIHITYDKYYKFISKEFSGREEALADREVRALRCYKCDNDVKIKIRWFSGKSHAYYCLGYCPVHGWIRGKIRIKKTDENRTYVVKTVRIIEEERAQKIRHMKEEIADKRRERRHTE